MDKDGLLKSIAETGYNVGFGAKKHFATYDIVDKVPGLIGSLSMMIGVYGLVFDALTGKILAATLVVAGIVGLYISFNEPKKAEYDHAGQELTQIFNKLRDLYRTVQVSEQDAIPGFAKLLTELENDFYSKAISKQILFSDWYAHYKFFWQHQIDWIEEQKSFRLFRDKIPLSFTITLIICAIGISAYVVRAAKCG